MSQSRLAKIWLSRGEACRQMGVSSGTFARLVEDGRVGVLDLPGLTHRRYRASDVARLVNGGTTPAKAGRELIEA